MTEVFGVATAAPELALKKPGAVGRPVPHVEVEIADDMGARCKAGDVGEVWIRGPGVTPGYWRQPEVTRAAFNDGWLRSGDLGYLDEDGVLYLVDRKKDMYISGGENVYPAEVENVLAAVEGVDQAAVIGVPDPTWGEVGAAFVTSRPGQLVATEQLLAACRRRLAAFKVPKSITVLPVLPMSAQGKVRKSELRELYAAQH
jgi:fatty-acyl-CoA synthase